MQGAPLIASILETEILPARVEGYQPSDLDALTTAGEVVWGGLEPLGEHDGRLALYLTDHVGKAAAAARAERASRTGARRSSSISSSNGASFFAALHEAAGGGYPGDTVDAIWTLVWAGAITNDSLHAVRAFTRPAERQSRKARRRSQDAPAAPQVQEPAHGAADRRGPLVADDRRAPERRCRATESATALAQQLLARYGVLTREVAAAEGIAGGFSAVYDVLKALEDAGRIRRGYFASGVGATQFALPAALDLLRSLKDMPDEPEVVVLAATDPGQSVRHDPALARALATEGATAAASADAARPARSS